MKGVKIMIGSWLISLLIFIVGLYIMGMTIKRAILKKRTPHNKAIEAYWEREYAATFARRKDIPDTLFISVDFDKYPATDNTSCQMLYDKILSFKTRPMINLKGQSNVTLKELYGTMQLEKLAYYEQNLMEYMHASCAYGKTLLQNNYLLEAQQVLEYTISLGCDLSQCFLTLAELYHTLGDVSKLEELCNLTKSHMVDSPYFNKVITSIEMYLTNLQESEMLS